MKKSFITESILYWLARGLSAVAGGLSPGFNAALGARVGDVVYRMLPKRRVAALKNLRAAFGGQYTPAQYQRIIRSMFQNLGMTLMEIARIPRIDRAYVERWITLAPGARERLDAALEKGRGVILLTGHFGNWELISITGALLGYPALVLAREQGWTRLNRLITQYRESKGCRVVTKGFPIRELIRGLREGRIVGIVSDQDGGRNGLLAPFLGRLASTAPGAIALGLETEAPILPLFMIRTKGAAHTLIIEEPIQVSPEKPMDEQIKDGLTQYLQALERVLRRHPDQWLWLHRRWKSSPQRRLLILSDGKAGHLNQSRVLGQQMQEAWESRMKQDRRLSGLTQDWVRTKVVEVSFRHPLWRIWISMVASFVPRRFSGGDRWLRLGLTSSCYQVLRCEYADLSISCGASTAAVNLLWAWGVGARNVHITRTRFPSWRRFDLAIIPRHDLRERRGAASSSGSHNRPPRRGSHLLVVDGALTPPFAADAVQMSRWRQRLQVEKPRQIGLLLGGPTRGIAFNDQKIERLILGLLESCQALDAELLVTSSRRTPASVETRLAKLLKEHPRCRLLALVGSGDSDRLESVGEAVACILGLSQALVVSGDSISMISEAVSTRKPVIGFIPTATGQNSSGLKYHRFLNDMKLKGHVNWVEPEKVGEAVVAALEKGTLPATKPAGRPQEASLSSPDETSLQEYLRKWL